MTRRFLIPALCVAAFATADSALRHVRERSTRPGPVGATASALHVLDAPLALRPFTAVDIEGRDVSPASWRGSYAIVNFWATWCAPCRTEIPDLVALQAKYQGGLRVVGVLQDQVSIDFVRVFAKSLGMSYPIVLSTWEIDSAFGDVLVLPTSYFVDPAGRIVATHIGPIDIVAVGAWIDERVATGDRNVPSHGPSAPSRND